MNRNAKHLKRQIKSVRVWRQTRIVSLKVILCPSMVKMRVPRHSDCGDLRTIVFGHLRISHLISLTWTLVDWRWSSQSRTDKKQQIHFYPVLPIFTSLITSADKLGRRARPIPLESSASAGHWRTSFLLSSSIGARLA
jgi:hypothetical protein